MRHSRRLRTAALAGLALGAAIAVGCGSAAERRDVDRQAIEATLRAYLAKLSDAYTSGDAEVVRPEAVPKEVAAVQKRIDDLAREGRQLRPELRNLTLEEVEVWRYSNAYANTHEVWDLRVYALGSDTKLSEELGQVNRVKYQLEKVDGQWKVLYREIQRD